MYTGFKNASDIRTNEDIRIATQALKDSVVAGRYPVTARNAFEVLAVSLRRGTVSQYQLDAYIADGFDPSHELFIAARKQSNRR